MKRLSFLFALMVLLIANLMAEDMNVSPYQNDVRLLQSSPNNMILELSLGNFSREAVLINGETWYNVSLKKEGLTLEAGLPQVPTISRSLIIPGTAAMQVNVVNSEYVDIPMQVAPSKGNLTRDIDPATVPYSFASFYSGNDSYPAELAGLSEPFILRDYRGITVRFQPFEYFPATETLRVYTKVQVSVVAMGTDMTNAISTAKNSYSRFFEEIYRGMFLNFQDAKYPMIGEEGRILVIKNSMFDTAIMPYVNWKRQNGYQVDVVDVSVAGPTANQIKTYIQNQYDLNNGLMFVQLVGDAPQIPTLSSGGGGSDPSFALVAGTDSYPDIYIGRFSAQTVAELETQVLRTVQYERDLQPGADWLQRGMGIASNEGGGSQGDMGESDQVHMDLIRTDLLGYGYISVDQMYQTMGATATQVGTNINAGRGFINYVGHGSDTSWVTTGFNNTNVNNLVNDNMLPFIVSVACVNGNFVSQTCFAEAWLRATNGANPTGAVAMYASTVNQGWNPPMRGQDEVTDLLIAETRHTIGGLYYHGSAKMIEVYGTSGISEYKNWTIFGDASLTVRTKDPMAMSPSFTPILMIGMNTFSVQAPPFARVTLMAGDMIYGTTVADASGAASLVMANPPLEPMDLTLTITAFNYATYIGTVQVLPAAGPYVVVDSIVLNGGATSATFGETVNVNIVLSNVGADEAVGVTVTGSTTDPYITITSSTEAMGNIAAHATGSTTNGFSFQVSSSAPDQHQAAFTIDISLSTGQTYQYERSFLIDAPNFSWGALQVSEVTGNGNGRIDAGEVITVTIPVSNDGHAAATNLDVVLMVNNVDHLIDPILTNVTELPVGGDAIYIYQISFSSQIPVGTVAQIAAMLYSGDYTAVNTYNVTIGLMIEDFEAGFNSYPWTFTGGNWSVAAESYNNSSSSRSATINHNGTTSMNVSMNVPVAGNISFWKKVSSEQNYDYLKFYINGVMKNQWSGTSDTWSQVTYAVQAGQNVFKWEYMKDSMVSSGSDCAWIDDIIFPGVGGATGTPVLDCGISSYEFDDSYPGFDQELTIPLQNTGDASMLIQVNSVLPFRISPNETQNLNMVLSPGESYELVVSVSYEDMSPGLAYNETLMITTDSPSTPVHEIALQVLAGIVDNDDNLNPMVTTLKGNYPNPFNPSTTIAFSLKEASPVQIQIFNIHGQVVRTLVNNQMNAGHHSVEWNGRDNSGRGVASGIYFYRMRAGNYNDTRKMMLVK